MPAEIQYGTSSGNSVVRVEGRGKFEVLPNISEAGRDVILVMGKSGTGKSYFMRTFAANYQKLYPRREVFLLSGLDRDATLDSLAGVNRIDRTKLASDKPERIEPWRNSLVLVDDVETLQKDEAEAADKLQSTAITQGRHEHVSYLRAMHPVVGKLPKPDTLMVAESDGIVVYPGTSDKSYVYLLARVGVSEAAARRILSVKDSRWVYVHHTPPRFTVSEFEVRLF
jgi:type II secretory pathway predicted ATPase ExeA